MLIFRQKVGSCRLPLWKIFDLPWKKVCGRPCIRHSIHEAKCDKIIITKRIINFLHLVLSFRAQKSWEKNEDIFDLSPCSSVCESTVCLSLSPSFSYFCRLLRQAKSNKRKKGQQRHVVYKRISNAKKENFELFLNHKK